MTVFPSLSFCLHTCTFIHVFLITCVSVSALQSISVCPSLCSSTTFVCPLFRHLKTTRDLSMNWSKARNWCGRLILVKSLFILVKRIVNHCRTDNITPEKTESSSPSFFLICMRSHAGFCGSYGNKWHTPMV